MTELFAQPIWLLLLPPLLLALWKYYRAHASVLSASRQSRRRLQHRMALLAASVTLLVLAAAGLQIPALTQKTRLVIAADVSPSIIEPQAQNQWLQGLVSQLDRSNSELGIVVFSGNAGTERPLSRLPEPDQGRVRRRDAEERLRAAGLPDLTHPATVVDTHGTDIGAAIERCRGLFGDATGGARGIVLLSDFRDTRGHASAAAAALAGSGIDLLAAPASQTESGDVRIAALRVPDRSRVGRAIPIEVTVAAQSPCEVEVKVMRKRIGRAPLYIDAKKIKLEASDLQNGDLRQTIRFVDPHAEGAGVETYIARVSRPEGEAAEDVVINNQLAAAVRIDGTSTWAVLTRKGLTLETLCQKHALGVETKVFTVGSFPKYGQDYAQYEGILIDGLSATELDDAALKAIAEAVENGKGIVALGGETAFGAGAHARDGVFEQILPVYMTPEDDRTRAILFAMDVSSSMDEKMGPSFGNVRKIDFAGEQLAQAVQRLKDQDRLGLITFSGDARLAAPLSTESRRETFLNAVKKARIESSTDLLAPLTKAKDILAADDSEEQIIMLLSDGKQTVNVPESHIIEAARELCPPSPAADKPRRRMLYTFGIDVRAQDADAAGEKLMKDLAAAGGGKYSPDFTRLGEVVENTFEQKKDFFVRREAFALKTALLHPLVGTEPLPPLAFRNRVKARSRAETLLVAQPGEGSGEKAKNRPDPLLVLSGTDWPGAARSAVLALSLDGPDGTALLNSPGGGRLLPGILEWVEDREENSGLSLTFDASAGDGVEATLRVTDARTGLQPRRFELALTALPQSGESAGEKTHVPLSAAAPGLYRARVPSPEQGIYRASVMEHGRAVLERYVTIPYPAEYRRFGTSRSDMIDLVKKAGGKSRVLNRPPELQEWLQTAESAKTATPLTGGLCAGALALFMLELLLRYIRVSRT